MKQVEKQQRFHKTLARKEIKLLLLGTGESGKSTLMKQMKIIHDNGFTSKELETQRKYVFHNTITCMQTILSEMKILEIPLESTKNQARAELVLTLDVTYENVGNIFKDD